MDGIHSERINAVMDLVEAVLNELTYAELGDKQRDITQLFPTFKKRVQNVAGNGGVNLMRKTKKFWHFRVASGTEKNKSYDVTFHWQTVEQTIKEIAEKEPVWTKGKKAIDLRKLASALMYKINIKTVCSCPADLYYGGHYIRTQRKAKAGRAEKRPPVIRNKNQYGAYCKHTQLVMNTFPFYISIFTHWVKQNYGKYIAQLQEEIKRTKRRGKGKKAEDKPEEPTPEENIDKESPEDGKEAPEGNEPEENEDV